MKTNSVRGLSKVVRKASSGERDGNFGINTNGAADSRDEGTRSWEVGYELLSVRAVIGRTGTAPNTGVAAGEHDATAAGSELGKEVAGLNCVVKGHLYVDCDLE